MRLVRTCALLALLAACSTQGDELFPDVPDAAPADAKIDAPAIDDAGDDAGGDGAPPP